MQIRLYATLRQIAGTRELEIPVEVNQTVGDVLRTLVARYPRLEQAIWHPDGSLAGHVTVILNGRDIRHLDGIETPVTDFDRLDVFPPVGGGSGQDQPRKVKLRFLGDFHSRVENPKVEFSFEGDRLHELIPAVIEEFEVKDLFIEDDTFKPYLRVLINGRISHLIGGFEAEIPEGSTVVFSMIGGVQNAARLPDGTRFFELKEKGIIR